MASVTQKARRPEQSLEAPEIDVPRICEIEHPVPPTGERQVLDPLRDPEAPLLRELPTGNEKGDPETTGLA